MDTGGRMAACALALALLSAEASAVDLQQARALFEEGKALLKKARASGGDAIHGSHEAIKKLEEAQGLLQEAPEGSPAAELLQNVNSLIFWARRTTPLDVRSLVKSSGASTGVRSSSSTSAGAGPAKRAPSNPAEASRALARAEAYARNHSDDPVTCAARFFEVADRYKDLHDVAFKAISRCQEFQRLARERAALRESEAKFAALPPDGKLEVEGDRAYAKKNFEKAIIKFRQAIATKETAGRRRKLGHALFERAQQLRGEYTNAYLEGRRKFLRARSRGDKRGMQRALAENERASAISKDAIAHYEEAEKAFRAAWNACDRVDLDSELHMALALVVRKEARYVRRAKQVLERILFTYHDDLVTDEERTLYAYAETYAGEALVAKARKQIARTAGVKLGGPGEGGDGEEAGGVDTASPAGEKPLQEMSDDDLREALASAESALRKDEHRLQAHQATGRFDKELLDKVNAERERLEALEREAERRRLR